MVDLEILITNVYMDLNLFCQHGTQGPIGLFYKAIGVKFINGGKPMFHCKAC